MAEAPVPVAFVVSQMGKRADGGVRSISLVIDLLARKGAVRPLVVTNAETDQTRAWRSEGYEVAVWPVPPPPPTRSWRHAGTRVARGASILALNARLARQLRAHGTRVVHCNDYPGFAASAGAAGALRIPISMNIRDTLGVRGAKWKLMRAVAAEIIVLSDEMKSYVERELAPPAGLPGRLFAPVRRIYSIVDPTAMAPAAAEERLALRGRLGIPADEIAIGVVAAVVWKKQHRELLLHLASNPDALPARSRLHFVGDFTPDRDAYSAECAAIAAPLVEAGRVSFVGYTRDVRDWYRALDLTLVPSAEEGLARCMIESLSCGTPVVSFDVCSAREILEGGRCGRVVAQGDFEALMAAVRELAGDDTRRAAQGATGAEHARSLFAPDAVAAGYSEVYRRLASRA